LEVSAASESVIARRCRTLPKQRDGLSDILIEVNDCAIRQVINSLFVDKFELVMGVPGQTTGDIYSLVMKIVGFAPLRVILGSDEHWVEQQRYREKKARLRHDFLS